MRSLLSVAAVVAVLGAMGGCGTSAPANKPIAREWKQTIEIDPAGIATEDDFMAMLGDKGLKAPANVNWYTGRWPNMSFIGGTVMGNESQDLMFFYSTPTFRWWTQVLDYVMQDGGDVYGIRAIVHPYKDKTYLTHRSYLLTVRTDTMLADYHPSYVLVNNRRVWDSKVHPMQQGKIVIPFWLDEPSHPVIDFVIDKKYTPEVKGLAFRMFFLKYLGGDDIKVSLKGAATAKEASPADTLPKYEFGLFRSKYDFWTKEGPTFDQIAKMWKPNFKPDYPTDPVWLAPHIHPAVRSEFQTFMLTYGGCNVAAASDEQTMKEGGKNLVGILAKPRDVQAAKALLEKYPGLKVQWFEGEMPIRPEQSYAEHLADMAARRGKLAEVKQATGAPDRILDTFEPFPPAVASAHFYEAGTDLLVLKNEEDPSYNILMSMSRGAGRSFGKPYGFYWEQSHYPFPSLDEKLHCNLLYYLSGANWIGAEAESAPAFKQKIVADWVFPYVQAMRFAMQHPARGTPIVPNAVLWTYGDRYTIPYNIFGEMDTFLRHIEFDFATRKLTVEPEFTRVYPWMPQDRKDWGFRTTGQMSYFIDHLDELRGYDLLDVFFPKFGDAFTAKITRLLTGTPYGPVDFVYGDGVSADQLKTYGAIAVLGHATMTPELEKKLTVAMEAGANVVLGAQHFKSADGKLVSAFGLQMGGQIEPKGSVKGNIPAFSGHFAENLLILMNNKVYEFKGEGWQPVLSVAGQPLMIRKQVGKGMLHVYLEDRMTDTAVEPVLRKLAAHSAPLVFDAIDDQLEYVAYKKGAGAWVALFNHGGIAIGNDKLEKPRVTPPEPLVLEPKGPYKGTISFRLDKLGLDAKAADFALYEVVGIDARYFDDLVAGRKGFEIKAVPFELKDGVITAKVRFDKRAEYVIAPKGKASEVFFGK